MHFSIIRVSTSFPSLSYIIFKILGLAPFNIKLTQKNKPLPIFIHSHLGTLYNLFLIIIITSLTSNAVNGIIKIHYPNKSSTTDMVALTKASLGVTVLIIVWLHIIISQKSAVKIANVWKHTDDTLKTLEYVKNRKLTAFQLPIYFALNVIIWINIVWTDLVTFEEWFKTTFIAIVAPSFIFTWLILQYTFVLILLKERFRTLNMALKHLSSKAFVVPFYFNSTESALDDVITEDLIVIKASYEVLYEIACDISSLFSLPIFFVISTFCASIIYSSYYLATVLLLTRGDSLIIYNSLCYLSMEIFPIAVLSIAATTIRKEMKLTAVAVHKLLRHSFIKAELKSQLKLFSLELLNRDISFTGCNIFSLDGTLLHSIFNTTVTYIIILFQFGKSDESPQTTNSTISNP